MIDVTYHCGLELAAHSMWLDPHCARPFAFVSHAHSDHIGRHTEVLATAATARLMRARLGGRRIEHVLEFGRTAHFRGLDVTLLPAGHILGSAQFFAETDAGTLLYTGDFKLRPSLSCETAAWRRADTLIMETTFALPRYVMPPTERVLADIVAFCRETLDAGAAPVLLGYSLGKAQEIICALIHAGLTPMLHESVFEMTELCRELHPGFPSGYERWSAREAAGKVLVFPPNAQRSPTLERIGNTRTAMLTGWALDPGARYRFRCDAAFPLTDHADYPDLLRYVELVQPRRVFTVHGFAAEFARDLRALGIEAWAMNAGNQLEFDLRAAPTRTGQADADC